MVETIATRMAARRSIDDAEAELVSHLEVSWDFFEASGVNDREIEHECRQFARAAWRRFEQLQHETGAA